MSEERKQVVKKAIKKTATKTAKKPEKKVLAVPSLRELYASDALKLLFPIAEINQVRKVIRDKFPSDDFYFNCDDTEERRFVKSHLQAEKKLIAVIDRVPINETRIFRGKLDAIKDELVASLKSSSKPLNDSLNAWQAKRDEERKAKAEAKRLKEEAERAELEKLRAEAEEAKREKEREQIRQEAKAQALKEAEERAERERQALIEHNKQLAEQAKQLAEAQEQMQAYAREQEQARIIAEQEAQEMAQEQAREMLEIQRQNDEQLEALRQAQLLQVEQEQTAGLQQQATIAINGAELNGVTHNSEPTKSQLLAMMGLTKIDLMLAGGINEEQARRITLAIKRGQIRNALFCYETLEA